MERIKRYKRVTLSFHSNIWTLPMMIGLDFDSYSERIFMIAILCFSITISFKRGKNK